MTILPRYQGSGGTGNTANTMNLVGAEIHLSPHELDELFTTILLSDSPVAKDIADKLQPYAKKVSFR